MPGSRVKEVRMNLPTMLEAAAQLGDDYEFLLPVAPTLDRAFLKSLIEQQNITLVPNRCRRSGIRAPASSPAARRQWKQP
jgi:lipid A disaccharide synthetase